MSTAYRHPLARYAAGTILGYRRNGRPIFVVAGGSTPPEPVIPPAPAGDQGEPPQPTGQDPATVAPAAPAPVDGDPTTTIARLEADLAAARKEAAKSRTVAKQNAADEARAELAQQIGKALGIVTDDTPPDPAKLTEQLTASQEQARQTAVDLAVYRNAAAAGGDPDALLDSRAFTQALAGLDPTDADAIKAAITTAVEANPKLAAAPRGPGRSGGDMGGAGGSGDTATSLDKQIAQAKADGNWREVMRLENSKLAAAEAAIQQ